MASLGHPSKFPFWEIPIKMGLLCHPPKFPFWEIPTLSPFGKSHDLLM